MLDRSRRGGQFWSVVLAGGEGERLAALARRLYGVAIPKQFLSFRASSSLLARTLKRVAPLFPAERVLVVMSAGQIGRPRTRLGLFRPACLLREPRPLGTVPAVFLGLCHVLSLDPDAAVAVLPVDHHFHHFARPERLLEGVRRARDAARITAAGVVILAAEARAEAGGAAWIVPGAPVRGARDVFEFRELVQDIDGKLAAGLTHIGALRSMQVLVGSAVCLWALLKRHLPLHAARFESCLGRIRRSDHKRALAAAYDRLPVADLEADVLADARGLGVARVSDAGWIDCDTPTTLLRVFGGRPLIEQRPSVPVLNLGRARPGPVCAGLFS
jgi:mannose-1-phosphate guanylyltransferase